MTHWVQKWSYKCHIGFKCGHISVTLGPNVVISVSHSVQKGLYMGGIYDTTSCCDEYGRNLWHNKLLCRIWEEFIRKFGVYNPFSKEIKQKR